MIGKSQRGRRANFDPVALGSSHMFNLELLFSFALGVQLCYSCRDRKGQLTLLGQALSVRPWSKAFFAVIPCLSGGDYGGGGSGSGGGGVALPCLFENVEERFLVSSKPTNQRLTKQENGKDEIFSPKELGTRSQVPLVVNLDNTYEMDMICAVQNSNPPNQNGDNEICFDGKSSEALSPEVDSNEKNISSSNTCPKAESNPPMSSSSGCPNARSTFSMLIYASSNVIQAIYEEGSITLREWVQENSGSSKRYRFVESTGGAREEEAQAKTSEPPSLATRKLLWCVETARLSCASQQEAVQGSPRDALSGERVTESASLPFVSITSFNGRILRA
ncbi:hypothetical protein TEA_001105 [Camellia sinensis var. sinensis]|uniref:Uncharacterized protein n=1 Tax=Camellia sinensis var. sinensis TaxID=542762 RepID=A0A4S4DC37_CAMSN|nr:hypothetical protein TEA_001105 [Camellia sinensis var. sinensis]